MAPERDDAHDPRRGPPERGVHPRDDRRLRGRARDRHALPARGGREDHRRSRRGHPRDRPRVRERAPRGDLLHPRHHRARVRGGQHLVARESRAHDRASRLRVDGSQRAPRAEQRPGAERLGREPVLPPRLSVGRRPGDPPEVLRCVGRRGADATRVPARPDRVGAARRPHQGAVPHRREPRPDRAERTPRGGGARGARLHDVAGHLPERLDAEVRRRRAARIELRREGRDVHEHRAPRQSRARGGAAARRGEGRP